jgi:hypothetical protein
MTMKINKKIFLTLFLTYAFFTNTYLTTSDASRFSLTASIVEEQTFQIDNFLNEVITFWWLPKDFASYKGNIYSDKAPLGSFLGVPIYLIFRIITSDFNILGYFVTLFTVGVLTSLTALLVYYFGQLFHAEKNARALLAFSFGLGSAAFFYSTVFFSHAITAFMGFASFYLLFKAKNSLIPRNFALAGILAALAISSDYTAGVIAVVLFGYAFSLTPRKAYLFFLPFLATLLPLFLYHWIAFENPFVTPYLYANLYSEFHSTGFYGMGFLDLKFLSQLATQLFAPWGFFFTTPLALLSFAYLPKFYRSHKKEAFVIVAITIGLFYVAGNIGRFDAYSSRLLVPLIPFLILPLYTIDFKDIKFKTGFLMILIVSILINLAGVDTFLPKIVKISVISSTYGNHNLLGEFLLNRGINIHYITILPLFFIYTFIWRHEIQTWIKDLNLG